MGSGGRDWGDVQRRLLASDRLAFLEVNRLVTGVLIRMRAYDFREEWDDLRQEVLLAVVAHARAGRLRDPAAFVGYVRVVTRNKLVDRIKRRLRCRERDAVPWDEATARLVSRDGARPDGAAADVWAAVRALPDAHREVIERVYREGKAYQEVSDETGVPLGTVKRRLTEALRALRARLGGEETPR